MSANQSPTKTPRQKPSKKQQAAIACLMANPHATVSEAMRVAGYAENTIDNPTQNFVGLPTTQSMAEQLRATVTARITPEVITNKIERLMDAQRVVSARVTNREADVDTDDFIEVPDHPTQLKATELAMKVYNLTDGGGGNNLFVNFGDLKSKYKKDND